MSTDQPSPYPLSPQSEQSPEHLEQLSRALADLRARCASQGTGEDWVWRYEGGGRFHMGASVMIHGDEVGPLLGLLDVIEALEQGRLPFVGRFTCFLGNPRAAARCVRFTEEDLNRCFKEPHPSPDSGAELSYEVARAQALSPLLDELDLYLDFHQTILPVAQPFYICPWSVTGWRWARLMGGAQAWVTRHPQRGGGGLACADAVVAKRGKPSLALELGALGFQPEARAAVWRSLSRAFNAINSLYPSGGRLPELSLEQLAERQPDLSFYETGERFSFSDPMMQLSPGWVNFSPVQAGQLLSDPEHGPLIMSPATGALLFPKYPPRDDEGAALDPRPSELFRVVRPLSAHPTELWPDVID